VIPQLDGSERDGGWEGQRFPASTPLFPLLRMSPRSMGKRMPTGIRRADLGGVGSLAAAASS
jgi:hypothetical protein